MTGTITITFAIAVLFFEVLPLKNWQDMIKKGTRNNNIIIVSKTREEDEHIIALVSSSVVGGVVRGVYNMEPDLSSTTKDKLVHSSFRIEQDVIKALEKAAEKRAISLSSLVNKTLKTYVSCEMLFEELGFILVSKDFLRKIFTKLDEKDIEEFGREFGITIAKEYVSYFYPEVDDKTLIQFLDLWFRRFSSCQHRINNNNNHHTFTVNHDINKNFSLTLVAILGGLIEPVIKRTVEFKNITPSSITFSFES